MTSRERVLAALSHRDPGRVPVDFGGTAVTGIHVSCVAALRDHYGLERRPVKVHEPYQMLGLVEEDLAEALGLDVVGVCPRKTMFGFPNENWMPFRMDDGLEVLVPGGFRTTRDGNGDTLIYPEGDTSVPATRSGSRPDVSLAGRVSLIRSSNAAASIPLSRFDGRLSELFFGTTS